ncbi:hypothetical protein C4588_04235 [Candidatus Parcubacteria bacterium]|nr:MAG: hypothetical protein C4588_04235 [Candidatus Parcubacteria bacterium]
MAEDRVTLVSEEVVVTEVGKPLVTLVSEEVVVTNAGKPLVTLVSMEVLITNYSVATGRVAGPPLQIY